MRVIIFFFLMSSLSWSQNLVLNPDFSANSHCPKSHSEFENNVTNWTLPTKGTSDYYNICSQKFNYQNPHGTQHAKKGKAYAGIVTLYQNKYNTLPDYREYIQGEIKSTLVKNRTYTIRIAISLADKANTALNEIELLFTEEKLSSSSEKNIDLKALKTRGLKTNTMSFRNDTFFYDKNEWMILEGTYKAKGFENFITIGNFKPDSATKKVQVSKPYLPIESYYYIDFVEIIALKTKAFQPKKLYRFKSVLFDFDKAMLLNRSIEELNQLAQHLSLNKTLNIEIYGHTDSDGLESRNKELSNQRAKAVANYLIKKGIAANRIKWFGFGAKYPIVKNNSDTNKATNRRVEYKLFVN